jgi:hypothetical protein
LKGKSASLQLVILFEKHSCRFPILREEIQFALLAPEWRQRGKGKNMSKVKKENKVNIKEMRAEYEFDYSKAVSGKYYNRLVKEGSNIIVLEPDVAESFPDSSAVNEALRSLLEFTNSTRDLTRRSTRRAKIARAPL